MTPWQLYFLLGILLFVAEILVPAFVLACFGMGCLLAGVVALATDSYNWHMAMFALGTFLAFIFVRPLFNRPKHDKSKTNVDAYVGRCGKVIAEISQGQGKVAIGGEIWNAISETSQDIPEGCFVIIVRVAALKLVVKPTIPNTLATQETCQ